MRLLVAEGVLGRSVEGVWQNGGGGDGSVEIGGECGGYGQVEDDRWQRACCVLAWGGRFILSSRAAGFIINIKKRRGL